MTETQPLSRRLGYARVRKYGQTLDAQLEQLTAEGCAKVYREKVSGARADRREVLRMLKDIWTGDVVTVTRIDRLARSTFDLFTIVTQIVDAGGQFRPLAEPWADTGISTGRLMIAVLGGLADVERDLIRTCTAEGRSRAKARGQHVGRPPSLTSQQQAEAQRYEYKADRTTVAGRSLTAQKFFASFFQKRSSYLSAAPRARTVNAARTTSASINSGVSACRSISPSASACVTRTKSAAGSASAPWGILAEISW